MFPLEKAIIFAPGNASKSRSIAAYVHSGRMMLGFYQFGILRADASRNICIAFIDLTGGGFEQLCCFAIEGYNVDAYRPVGEEGHSVMSQQPAEFMHLNGGIEPLIGL